jgi:hypothetical protein
MFLLPVQHCSTTSRDSLNLGLADPLPAKSSRQLVPVKVHIFRGFDGAELRARMTSDAAVLPRSDRFSKRAKLLRVVSV